MAANDRPYTVSELTARIKGLLTESFPSVSLEGEISNFKAASSGHWYFSLKDAGAAISAVMFRGSTRGVGFTPRDGDLVRATGEVSVYESRGQYQIILRAMSRAGQGDILALLEERKRRLAAEGLFEAARKRPLPRFPSRVAVITSPTGAAIRDILSVLDRRAGIDVVVLPAAVQGEGAAAELAAQLRRANRHRLGEVIILGRGGGSLEDLLAFSDEELVRAVAASEIPVISAVGHEIDWALTDYAADLRAATPSAAAELVSESRAVLRAEVGQLARELAVSLEDRMDEARALLSRFEPDAVEARFMRLLHPAIRTVDEARATLASDFRAALSAATHRLALARARLEASSPDAILARGYAVVKSPGGVVRDASTLSEGELLDITFARGAASARVLERQ